MLDQWIMNVSSSGYVVFFVDHVSTPEKKKLQAPASLDIFLKALW